MQKIRSGLIVLFMLLCLVTTAAAEVSIGIGLPNVSIGINLPLFPQLVRVPGYPVYYAPELDVNYYFYDGYYWVYQDDNWYASSWYNGPWSYVEPEFVPLYILRIPVRYYRQPPPYFRGWQRNAPPRWGQHWGRDWEHRRRGWDRWNRGSAPRPAPLPVYQRQYSGDRYPRAEQQSPLRDKHYRYQPRDKEVRQHIRPRVEPRETAPAQRGRQEAPAARSPRQQEPQRSAPQQGQPSDSRSQPAQRGGERIQRPAPERPAQQQPGPARQAGGPLLRAPWPCPAPQQSLGAAAGGRQPRLGCWQLKFQRGSSIPAPCTLLQSRASVVVLMLQAAEAAAAAAASLPPLALPPPSSPALPTRCPPPRPPW